MLGTKPPVSEWKGILAETLLGLMRPRCIIGLCCSLVRVWIQIWVHGVGQYDGTREQNAAFYVVAEIYRTV